MHIRRSLALTFALGIAGCAHRTSLPPQLEWRVPPSAVTACSPSSAPADPKVGLVVRPGRYALTLVATSGTYTGTRSRGRLWLAKTSATDRSPRTGRLPARVDTLDMPLYGAASVDFGAVAALLGEETPTSVDPIYPGVLAFAFRHDSPMPQRVTLLIGSIGNVRDGTIGLDGSGIALEVLSVTEHGFAGTWGPAGIVVNGSGYFCAHAVEP